MARSNETNRAIPASHHRCRRAAFIAGYSINKGKNPTGVDLKTGYIREFSDNTVKRSVPRFRIAYFPERRS